MAFAGKGKPGSFAAIDFSAAIAIISLVAALALVGLQSNAAFASGLLRTARLERNAITVADWLLKHCAGENGFGIAFCENASGIQTRASHVVSTESALQLEGLQDGAEMKEFFGIGENESVSISLGAPGEKTESTGGACVARLVLAKSAQDNFSSPMLGSAGLGEKVLRVCVGGGK